MAQLVHMLEVRTSSGKTLTGGAAWAALEAAAKRNQKKGKK